jgi:MFS-type transporter involved in bile tolerance (Atg22 family)
MYDWANSEFAVIILTAVIQVYYCGLETNAGGSPEDASGKDVYYQVNYPYRSKVVGILHHFVTSRSVNAIKLVLTIQQVRLKVI